MKNSYYNYLLRIIIISWLKLYNAVQIIYLRKEYLISHNCMQKKASYETATQNM